jgi:hypothetical protein
MKEKLSKFVDPTRCYQLVSGVLGIYLSYLVTGIIHESMYLLYHSGLKNLTKITTLELERSLYGLQGS